jgi:putative lipoic acid-binding regulatory protein
LEYPACFHFRIITETQAQAEPALLQAVQPFHVLEPLVPAQASSSGRYTAFSVSVLMQSRAEMESFDSILKQVPGVRMVL